MIQWLVLTTWQCTITLTLPRRGLLLSCTARVRVTIAEESDMDIGFIGAGNMGAGMANNLLKAGYTLTVQEVNRDRAAPLLEQGAPVG